jgi:Ca2+-binding RTX toxin-like protein
MIEVKGTRTAAAAQVDPADPLGLRREPLPAGRALAVWMGGLIGLALYLKSFLWPGEAAANPEPESGRAPDTGDDNQGIPTPHAMQARPGTAEPEPSAAHSASEASEAHRPSMLSRPEAVSRFDSRFAASLPALKLPTPFLSANDVLPPFRPLRDPVPETVVPRSGGGVGSAGAGAPPTGGRPPPPLPGDRDGTADPRNRAPRNSGPVNLGEVGSGATLAIALSHLLAKTADADGDVLTVSMGGASQGQIGSVSGGWRYLADTEALGEVTLRFRVSDGTALVEQTATLTVVENLFSGSELADLLVGTQGRDRILGKGGDDNLAGLGGRDRIEGGDGADNIAGGAGNDSLDGGAGDDVIAGGAGHDWIAGGAGNDRLHGEAGDDVIEGEAGDDLATGDAGNDTLRGGTGRDTLAGGADDDWIGAGDGNDSLQGDAGHDALFAEAGADHLSGGSGNDQLFGGTGGDSLAGDDGQDLLAGDAGDDRLDGGAGADILMGGAGADSVSGGAGADVVLADDDAAADQFDGGDGLDQLTFSAATDGVEINLMTQMATGDSTGEDSFDGFETFVGSTHDDVFVASDETATLTGNGGADLYQFQPGDTVAPVISIFQITDFDSDDLIWIATAQGARQIRKAQAALEDSIDNFFEEFSEGINADEPRLRYSHEWTDSYQRTLVEVDFDHDDHIDLTLQIDGEHLLALDRA